ncbi:MAG: MoxR family ATPase [Firmicutes bacterium]|nr:MoxR family ATPase [Bacillota bacterium]
MDNNHVYQGSDMYIASPELLSAVNVSVALNRPLLIKGEPGTGKTMLARSIADNLQMDLVIWNIKSTTKAQDGLYVYDTVQRLYDGQFGEGDVRDVKRYIKLGMLGEAFVSEERVVLLIDEIDKADIEFPNDLLWELDQMSFYIHETGETVEAKHRPIVVITSNAEKELPDAFLRRCIFHYIVFPDENTMRDIVSVHYPRLGEELVQNAIKAFYGIRELPNLQKRPSTSELLDWVQALSIGGVDPDAIISELPLPGVLLKKDQDMAVLQRRFSAGEDSPVAGKRNISGFRRV